MKMLHTFVAAITSLVLAMSISPSFAAKKKQQVDDLPKANPRYVISGGEVYDKNTRLTWSRCSVGKNWKEGIGCVGITSMLTFNDAQKLNGDGWRVPTSAELSTLLDLNRLIDQLPTAIDEIAFPNLEHGKYVYWSSTPAGTSAGWYVNFADGSVSNYGRGYTNAVRLVRISFD